MVDYDGKIEILKQRIRAVFDALNPPDVITPHDCDECFEVGSTFANKDWRTIESEILEENFANMSLMSPEAFNFFLPAYLLYSLDNIFTDSLVAEFTVYALTPGKEIKKDPTWWQEKFKTFTQEQLELIYEFLDLVKESDYFISEITSIERGKQRLKEYIEPKLINKKTD